MTIRSTETACGLTIGDMPDYDRSLHHHLADLIGAFLSLPLDVVLQNMEQEIRKPGGSVARAWERARPLTSSEITRFYQETYSYLYDLAVNHCSSARKRVWRSVAERVSLLGSGLSLLCYGDGIGTDSLALASVGHLVTYYDLPGITSRFAAFRIEREGFGGRIRMLSDAPSIPRGAFDAVICIEVLEHLPDPLGVMRELVSYARVGGRILLTESFGSIGADYPSHLPGNAAYAGLTCQLMERLGVANTYYSVDPINYPMEFTKFQPGVTAVAWRLIHRARRALDTRLRRWSGTLRSFRSLGAVAVLWLLKCAGVLLGRAL